MKQSLEGGPFTAWALRLATIVALGVPCAARAGLQVFPTRVYLSDDAAVANLTLRHVGQKPMRYRISTVFYRMKPDGSIAVAPDPQESERPAVKLLRFSPRTVTLPPNIEQVVRVMYAGPKNLPEGEYRAHLHLEPDEDDDSAGTIEMKKGKMSMQLHARVAVAVPVIYRHGHPAAEVALSGLKVIEENKKAFFSLDMASSGPAFPYGDFHAFFVAPGAAPEPVGLVRGVASYLPKREVKYELSPAKPLKGGVLRLEYRQPEDAGGKVLATAEAKLP